MLIYVSLIIVLAIFIVVYVFLVYSRPRISFADQKKIVEKWRQIEHERDFKKAILEADKLLDFTLKKLRYQGSLGGKLKKARRLFRNNNEVWTAHKLRNRVAHEIDIYISHRDGKSAIRYFKKGLQDLGIKI